MATPRPAKPVKLFVGLLSSDPDLLQRARQLLVRRFGPADRESALWPFTHTDYYEPEMGPDLQRWFVGFQTLISPERLPDIKIETNALEQEIGEDCLLPGIPRPVNIDPGYLELTKLVLATTKDRGHRLYLGHGIYGEVTLQYASGAWQTLPWTYPDYAQPACRAFFADLRDRFREQHRVAEDALHGAGLGRP